MGGGGWFRGNGWLVWGERRWGAFTGESNYLWQADFCLLDCLIAGRRETQICSFVDGGCANWMCAGTNMFILRCNKSVWKEERRIRKTTKWRPFLLLGLTSGQCRLWDVRQSKSYNPIPLSWKLNIEVIYVKAMNNWVFFLSCNTSPVVKFHMETAKSCNYWGRL